jgi:hypothetical protein
MKGAAQVGDDEADDRDGKSEGSEGSHAGPEIAAGADGRADRTLTRITT